MSDLLGPNQDQSIENNTPNQVLIRRLLKRKAASGFNISKIRNRITRITKNAHQIRQKMIVAAGDQRRKNLKAFGSNQVQKQTQAIKKVIKTPVNKQANLWDHLDLTLSNGSNVEKPDVNMVSTGQQLSGFPTGGQVITPFEPPEPKTRPQPSFIERREARLKREREQQKSTFKKPDKVSKLFSHIEEILPSGSEKKEIKPEKPAVQTLPGKPGKEKQIQKEEKASEPQSKIEKSHEEIQPQQINQIESKPVVQRQVETSKTDSSRSEKSDSKEDKRGFDGDKVVKPTSQKLPLEKDEIKTVGSKQEDIKKDQLPLEVQEPAKKINENIEKKSFEKKEIKAEPARKIVDRESTQNRSVNQEQSKVGEPKRIQKLDQPLVKNITDQSLKEPKSSEMIKPDNLSADEKPIQKEEKLSEEKLSGFQTKMPIINQKKNLVSVRKSTNDIISRKFEQRKPTKITPDLRKARGTRNLVLRLPSKPEKKVNPHKFLLTKKKRFEENQEVHSSIELNKPFLNQDVHSSVELNKSVENQDVHSSFELNKSVVNQKFDPPKGVDQPNQLSTKTPSSKGEERLSSKVQTENKNQQPAKGHSTDHSVKDIPTQNHDLTLKQTPLSAKITRKFSPRQVVSKKPDITSKKNQNLPIVMRSFDKQDSKLIEEQIETKPVLNQVDQINRKTISQKPERSMSLSEKQKILMDKVLVTRIGARKIQEGVLKQSMDMPSIGRNTPAEKQPGVSRTSSAVESSKLSNKVHDSPKTTVIQPSGKQSTEKAKPQSDPGVGLPLPQKQAMPFSKEELPVLKTKKIQESEPKKELEYSVPGPIVQREIDDVIEPSSADQQEVKVETQDLERLARDVYPIIKRWIAIEKERTSGRLY